MSSTGNTGNPAHLFPLKPAVVLELVADAYGLTTADLTGPRRPAHIAGARLVAYQLVHDECRLGWPGVAEVMGRAPAGAGGWMAKQARKADPGALAELRERLYNGGQRRLW
jgi:hypothetical protein